MHRTGTVLSIYVKALIPLFANVKFAITKPIKFTPYIECGVGYSFAPDKNANVFLPESICWDPIFYLRK